MTIQVGNPVSGENLMRLDKLEMSNETLAQVASGDTSALDGHEDAQIALVCLARELMRARATLEGLRPQRADAGVDR